MSTRICRKLRVSLPWFPLTRKVSSGILFHSATLTCTKGSCLFWNPLKPILPQSLTRFSTLRAFFRDYRGLTDTAKKSDVLIPHSRLNQFSNASAVSLSLLGLSHRWTCTQKCFSSPRLFKKLIR